MSPRADWPPASKRDILLMSAKYRLKINLVFSVRVIGSPIKRRQRLFRPPIPITHYSEDNQVLVSWNRRLLCSCGTNSFFCLILKHERAMLPSMMISSVPTWTHSQTHKTRTKTVTLPAYLALGDLLIWYESKTGVGWLQKRIYDRLCSFLSLLFQFWYHLWAVASECRPHWMHRMKLPGEFGHVAFNVGECV